MARLQTTLERIPPMQATPDEAIEDALQRHPDCKEAEWNNGLDALFRSTIVVSLWRNEECRIAGDPPRYEVEGYYP